MASFSRTRNKIQEILSSFMYEKDEFTKERTASNPERNIAENPGLLSMLCQPRNRENFYNRVETFSPFTWPMKPLYLSPQHCALYGWENTDVDLLTCVSCKATLDGMIGTEWDSDTYNATCEALRSNIINGHSKFCPWKETPCPESFLSLPSKSSYEWKESFELACKNLLSLEGDLPVLKREAFQDLEITEDALSILSSFITGSDTPSYHQDIIDTVCILALCGWNTSEKEASGILCCAGCHREAGLWNFYSLKSVSLIKNDQQGEGRVVEDMKSNDAQHEFQGDMEVNVPDTQRSEHTSTQDEIIDDDDCAKQGYCITHEVIMGNNEGDNEWENRSPVNNLISDMNETKNSSESEGSCKTDSCKNVSEPQCVSHKVNSLSDEETKTIEVSTISPLCANTSEATQLVAKENSQVQNSLSIENETELEQIKNTGENTLPERGLIPEQDTLLEEGSSSKQEPVDKLNRLSEDSYDMEELSSEKTFIFEQSPLSEEEPLSEKKTLSEQSHSPEKSPLTEQKSSADDDPLLEQAAQQMHEVSNDQQELRLELEPSSPPDFGTNASTSNIEQEGCAPEMTVEPSKLFGMGFFSPAHSRQDSLIVEFGEESLSERLDSIQSDLIDRGECSSQADSSHSLSEWNDGDGEPSSKRLKPSEDIEKIEFDVLAEHRMWCPWITAVPSARNLAENIQESPGWVILLEHLIQTASPRRRDVVKHTPPTQMWKSVRRLFHDCQRTVMRSTKSHTVEGNV